MKKKFYFSTFQLLLLTLFSALVVVAKIALRLPIRLSGHSGIFWMAIIIVAARVVPKFGASTVVGFTSGLLAAFLGLGDFGVLNTFLSYAAIGIGTDLMLLFMGKGETLLGDALVGAVGHVCKFLVKWVFGIVSGVPVGFVAFGLVYAFFSYILFGALGGLLGSLTVRALRKAGYFSYINEKK